MVSLPFPIPAATAMRRAMRMPLSNAQETVQSARMPPIAAPGERVKPRSVRVDVQRRPLLLSDGTVRFACRHPLAHSRRDHIHDISYDPGVD